MKSFNRMRLIPNEDDNIRYNVKLLVLVCFYKKLYQKNSIEGIMEEEINKKVQSPSSQSPDVSMDKRIAKYFERWSTGEKKHMSCSHVNFFI